MISPSESVKAPPLVSVVLLNYNGRKFASLWESLFYEGYSEKEIVFVDNGSQDESGLEFEKLANRFPQVRTRIIRLPENVGYSAGNNAGFAVADGEIVCLLSNDIKVSENWISPVVQLFTQDPSIAVVQSRQFRLASPEEEDDPTNLLDPFGSNHVIGPIGNDPPYFRDVFYAEGAVMFVRKVAVSEAGYLFPPDYFMSFEDADLCWRLRLRGSRCVVSTKSVVYHARGGTEPGKFLRKKPRLVSLGTRNRLATLFTNYSLRSTMLYLPIAILIEFGKAVGLLLRGYALQSRSIVEGVGLFLSSLPLLIKRRRVVQSDRTVDDRAIMAEMLNPIVGLKRTIGYWKPMISDLRAQTRTDS